MITSGIIHITHEPIDVTAFAAAVRSGRGAYAIDKDGTSTGLQTLHRGVRVVESAIGDMPVALVEARLSKASLSKGKLAMALRDELERMGDDAPASDDAAAMAEIRSALVARMTANIARDTIICRVLVSTRYLVLDTTDLKVAGIGLSCVRRAAPADIKTTEYTCCGIQSLVRDLIDRQADGDLSSRLQISDRVHVKIPGARRGDGPQLVRFDGNHSDRLATEYIGSITEAGFIVPEFMSGVFELAMRKDTVRMKNVVINGLSTAAGSTDGDWCGIMSGNLAVTYAAFSRLISNLSNISGVQPWADFEEEEPLLSLTS